jgi:hypothetical protein
MRSILPFALLTLATIAPVAAAEPMLDPAADDPGREWCYLAKSTTVIGVPLFWADIVPPRWGCGTMGTSHLAWPLSQLGP